MNILMGGSPCTHWSIAQKKDREITPEGIGWELFKNYLIAREKYGPDYFLYENNKSMSQSIRAQITRELGVEPILINSALVSAQSRQRLYWTNIPGVELPEDQGILLRDILETGLPIREKAYTLKANYGRGVIAEQFVDDGHFPVNGAAEPIPLSSSGKSRTIHAGYAKVELQKWYERVYNPNPNKQQHDYVAEPVRVGTIESAAKNADFDSQQYRVYSPDGKSVTLCGQGGGVGAKTGLYAVPVSVEWYDGKTYPVYEVRDCLITIKGQQYPIKLADGYYIIRKLTVTECKRLQTVPESYVFPVSDTQSYKMLGNGWTVDVIAHILGYIPGITTLPVEVLSMYDGMSCGHIALDKLGANVVRYYATEIDKYAIQTTQANYPDTVQLGDAFQVREAAWAIQKGEQT